MLSNGGWNSFVFQPQEDILVCKVLFVAVMTTMTKSNFGGKGLFYLIAHRGIS